MPHWFITLFLSSRQYLNQEETPYSLIRILDNFFVGSWKNLMKVGIFILHSCEENLRKMKYEEMLSYLINEIKKFDSYLKEKSPSIYKSIDNRFLYTVDYYGDNAVFHLYPFSKFT